MGGTRNDFATVVGDVDDLLRESAWRPEAWQEMCERLARALPGSSPTIVNYDLQGGQVVAAFAHGIAPEWLASYGAYYFSVNPWMEFWETVPEGRINVSERDSPARLFEGSEFYEDWLRPQGTIEAAVGLRRTVDPNNTIQLAWHYPLSYAPRYDDEAAAVLAALQPRLELAGQAASVLSRIMERGVKVGRMLSQVDGAALLVDADRQVTDANARAETLLREGRVFAAGGGGLIFRDIAAARWLEEAVGRLNRREPVAASTFILNLSGIVYQAHVSTAQDYLEPVSELLVRPRPQVLLVLRLLAGEPPRLEHSILRAVYGLSGAELRLCDLLASGFSISEAALSLDVSEGTVRQRVKTVFHKTHTHRQGELVALLSGFRQRS